jgi:hypothetical protein
VKAWERQGFLGRAFPRKGTAGLVKAGEVDIVFAEQQGDWSGEEGESRR